ncbi:MAG: copper amine oxidase N-terminal domain-containing protein, partial [Clostridia bacterium]|nr:copper amine oxidase N-terminal domain-containing protein [Clostridia bacterium]
WVGRNYYSVRQNGREERYDIDATPFVQNGRTFVPVRYLGLALGVPEAGIVYEPAAGKVTLRKGDTTVTLSVGSPVIYVNDRARSMDVAPLVRSGRTYLPARYVAEALGYRADWEASRGEVLITPR